METDQQKAEAEFKSILYDVSNPKHGLLLRGDPDTRDYMASLSKRITPPSPEPQPAPPQTGGTLGKAPVAGVDPGAIVGEKSPADSPEIAEQHLRYQWRQDFEFNMKMMEAGRDSVFHKGDPADEIVYDAVLKSPLANDPRFLEVLRTIGKEPLAVNVADISRFSEQERRDMAAVVAVGLLRDTGIPVDENHPIIRQLDEILDRKQLIDWGARLHQRLFRR
jgi:hypothetical protein